MNLGVLSTRKDRFWGLFRCASTRWCPRDDFSQIIVCSLFLNITRGFWPAEYFIGDYFGVPWHVDPKEKILSQIRVCNLVLNVPKGLCPSEYVIGDYFDVPRRVDAQEKIL